MDLPPFRYHVCMGLSRSQRELSDAFSMGTALFPGHRMAQASWAVVRSSRTDPVNKSRDLLAKQRSQFGQPGNAMVRPGVVGEQAVRVTVGEQHGCHARRRAGHDVESVVADKHE